MLTLIIFAVFVTPKLLILTIADESAVKLPLLIVPVKRVPIVKLLAFPIAALINPVLMKPAPIIPVLIELNAPVAISKEPIEPLLIDPAKSVPTVNVLAEPPSVLRIPTPAFPVLIELNAPVSISKEPIEPLLIDPAKSALTFRISKSAFPLLIELKTPLADVIELTIIVSVARTPESTKLPLLYPESAVVGIVASAYTPAGKAPIIRAAGILVKPIAEP